MFGYDLGIDLGSSSIVIAVPSKGIVVNEPSYVAFDNKTQKILYAGRRAYYLEGREPDGISVIRPIVNGSVINYPMAQQMIHYFINKVIKKSIFKPRVVTSVSSSNTDVERRSLISVIISAGARSVCLIEEPLAAAFGAGVDPLEPKGIFVIDIGGGSTDMAVVSQGSMNQISSSKIAGDRIDEEITQYLLQWHDLLVGKRTAEEIKHNIGSAELREDDIIYKVKGRDKLTGMPKTVDITSNEIFISLKNLYKQLTDEAVAMFERTTPQLVSDITNGSVIITGGCSYIYGIDKLFSEALKLDVTIAPRGELCVAKGEVIALNKMHILDQYGYRFLTKEDVRTR